MELAATMMAGYCLVDQRVPPSVQDWGFTQFQHTQRLVIARHSPLASHPLIQGLTHQFQLGDCLHFPVLVDVAVRGQRHQGVEQAGCKQDAQSETRAR
ncbi:hypothetical protein ASE28_12835 [Acidovorax sp. Root219]|nr:hypothetical protein ASE28_12835 [Acidovorax sp. Root219]